MVKLSEHSSVAVAAAFTKPMSNKDRRKLKGFFPTPDLSETRCPRLDSIFKTATASKLTKDTDAELTRIQAMIHDPIGPLTTLLHDLESEGCELTSEQFQMTLGSAITLLGSASAQVSRLTRKKILKAVNPEIQDLAEEDIYSAAAPLLFGEGFEKRMKERTESLKILSAAKTLQQPKQFFRGSRPTSPPRGGGSAARGKKPWWPKRSQPTKK